MAFDFNNIEDNNKFSAEVFSAIKTEFITKRTKDYVEIIDDSSAKLLKLAESIANDIIKEMPQLEQNWNNDDLQYQPFIDPQKNYAGIFTETRITVDVITNVMDLLIKKRLDDIDKAVRNGEIEEEWKLIPHFINEDGRTYNDNVYYASSLGRIGKIRNTRINSTNSQNNCGLEEQHHNFSPNTLSYKDFYIVSQNYSGSYLSASLGIKGDKRQLPTFVHKLVALAFHGYPQNVNDIPNHKDECKINNHKDNLAWLSKSGNAKWGLAPEITAFRDNNRDPFFIVDENTNSIIHSFRHPSDFAAWLWKNKKILHDEISNSYSLENDKKFSGRSNYITSCLRMRFKPYYKGYYLIYEKYRDEFTKDPNKFIQDYLAEWKKKHNKE